MGAFYPFNECEECGRIGLITWPADRSSAYAECRVPHVDPCGICTEWKDEAERLAILLERAPLFRSTFAGEPGLLKTLDESIVVARVLAEQEKTHAASDEG